MLNEKNLTKSRRGGNGRQALERLFAKDPTLKLISIEALEVGMYMVSSGLTWFERPYLFPGEGVVESARHIESIRRDGYTEVIIDAARGKDVEPEWLVPLDESEDSDNEYVSLNDELTAVRRADTEFSPGHKDKGVDEGDPDPPLDAT